MQTLTLQITDIGTLRALNDLASKKAIKIISKDEMNSPAFPGTPLSITAMKQWIAGAEASPTISLQSAKSEWVIRRKRLQQLGK
jgi:hypothetical protein